MSSRVKVVVTGAAGQIAYSLIPRLVDGKTFGEKTVDLCLVEIPQVVSKLEGLVMELEDSYFPNMGEVTYTDNFDEASHDADWFLLVGSIPRGIVYEGKKIEERSDLLKINGGIFVNQGSAIGKNGKDDAKILVVGNPANTNCLIAQRNAPSLDPRQFTAMTRLDHNRAKTQLAQKAGAHVTDIAGLAIWGNHSATQYPDLFHATVAGRAATDLVDEAWTSETFIPTVQQRGAAIIEARGLSSAASAANAATEHMRDWALGSNGEIVSMGIYSDGSYGIAEGLIYSFPCICEGGDWMIVQGQEISDFSRGKMTETETELSEERDAVSDLLPS